jgi:hypothetical protein
LTPPLAALQRKTENAGLPSSFVSDCTGLPIEDCEPVEDAEEPQDATVVLVNPDSTGETVHYTLDNQYSHAMLSGSSQTLDRKPN